jgi:hypothetical protein
MDKKPGDVLRRRQDLESELLAYLKARGSTLRKSLLSRFDPYMTGNLQPVLLDMVERGLMVCDSDHIVTMTALGQAQLGKRRRA